MESHESPNRAAADAPPGGAASAISAIDCSRAWLTDRMIAPGWPAARSRGRDAQLDGVRLVGGRLHGRLRCADVVEPAPCGRRDEVLRCLHESRLRQPRPDPERADRDRLLAWPRPRGTWRVPGSRRARRAAHRRVRALDGQTAPNAPADGAASTAARFDEIVHAPNRLQICAMLSAVSSADFATVREGLGVADSVLSKHVRVLHEAGYVEVHKSTCASRVRTSLSLTEAGRAAYDGHVAALRAIVSSEAFSTSAHRRSVPAGQGSPPAGLGPARP